MEDYSLVASFGTKSTALAVEIVGLILVWLQRYLFLLYQKRLITFEVDTIL